MHHVHMHGACALYKYDMSKYLSGLACMQADSNLGKLTTSHIMRDECSSLGGLKRRKYSGRPGTVRGWKDVQSRAGVLAVQRMTISSI